MKRVIRKIEFKTRPDRSKSIAVVDQESPPLPAGRVPRISRLMALVIHLDRLIREGQLVDQSDAALRMHVSQPRLTQLMNLTLLAPDIQERLLFLPRTTRGRDPVTERDLRPLTALVDWSEQRLLWNQKFSDVCGC